MRAVLLAVGAVLLAAPARATPAAQLSYARGPGAEGCPDQAALERAVSARLGEDPFHEGAGQQFRVEVVVAGDRFVGHVASVNAAGVATGLREFEGSNGCDELVSAMALVISLAINPDLASAPEPTLPPEGPPASAPLAPAQPKPMPQRSPELRPADTVDSSAKLPPQRGFGGDWGLSAGLLGLASVGTSPGPTAGAVAVARIRGGDWSLSLEGRLDAASSVALPKGSARTSLRAGLLVPCWHYDELAFCAAALVGSLRAESRGRDPVGSDSGLYAAAGGRVGAMRKLSPQWALEARVDVLKTLTPLTLVRNQTETPWRTPSASAAFGLGVVADLL